MGFLAIGLPIAATETTTTDHLRGLRLSGNEYVNVVGGTDGTAECPEGYIVQEVGYTVTDGDVVNEVLTYNGTVPIGVSITGTGTIVATVSCKYSDIVGTGGGGGSNPGTGIVALGTLKTVPRHLRAPKDTVSKNLVTSSLTVPAPVLKTAHARSQLRSCARKTKSPKAAITIALSLLAKT